MTLVTAYRLTMLAPIVLGGVCGAAAVLLGDRLEELGFVGAAVGWVALFAVAGLVYAGVPYAAFVAAACAWGRERPVRQLRGALYLSPLLFLVWFFIWVLGFVVLLPGPVDWPGLSELAWSLTRFIVPFGYACVALGAAWVALARHQGWVEPAA